MPKNKLSNAYNIINNFKKINPIFYKKGKFLHKL